jgi:hypothetical protein
VVGHAGDPSCQHGALGWNQLFNTKTFSVGPLSNIGFAFGAAVNTDDTTLGSAKRLIQAGVQLDFDAPSLSLGSAD